jgi:hypothetical protein
MREKFRGNFFLLLIIRENFINIQIIVIYLRGKPNFYQTLQYLILYVYLNNGPLLTNSDPRMGLSGKKNPKRTTLNFQRLQKFKNKT